MKDISEKILDISPRKWRQVIKEVYDIQWDVYFSTGMILWHTYPRRQPK